MSTVLTRSPLEPIGMNGAGVPKRRSARLSGESVEENEPPAKENKVDGAQTSTVTTKEADGDSGAVTKKKRKVYDEEVDGFAFSKSKRSKPAKAAPAVRNSTAEKHSPVKPPAAPAAPALPPPAEESEPKTARKRNLKRLPTTPEREKPVRRSKRLSDENEKDQKQASPHKAAHAKSHRNHERSPSPFQARPVTVEKKRRKGEDGVEEEKVMLIQLPFADTPVIKRNKEMRKASAENGSRRSSSGMRGRRASSLIDEGRGNALPHSEVQSSEFYKHISAELTEQRRMRCLLGWCGTRALPSKPEPPKENTPKANHEFQALQMARIIQEELSQDLVTKNTLSDWFSRDESAPPQMPLRKKANPRNVANAAKADELEKELERLKKERAEWDELLASAANVSSPAKTDSQDNGSFSPLRMDLLDSPQRAIFEQLQAPTHESSTDPEVIQQRLRHMTENIEFTVDQFAHGIHALSTAKESGEQLADQALTDAASVLEEREKEQRAKGKAVDPMDALKGLAKVLNSQNR